MIYPVRDWSRWYIADGFGSDRGTYFHNGLDINLKTGGDSDLGEDLLAVADGKIVYYHNNSHPNSNYGRHMVLECDTPRGKRWYHYAHCQEITASVVEVHQGDVIGKLGKSGTTYAHLHFSVFKVDPKSLYIGIDSVARNKTELNDYWEEFKILKGENMSNMYKGLDLSNQESMKIAVDVWVDVRDGKYIKKEVVDGLEKEIENLEKQVKDLKTALSNKEKDYETLALKYNDCLQSNSETKIDTEVEIGGVTWTINGVQVDSSGLVTANYDRKK